MGHNMKSRVRIRIIGRVQGVFFRQEMKHRADSLNVKGWVRNREDGSVEAVLEGEKQEIESLIEFSKRGPSRALVTDVKVKSENYRDEFTEFRIAWG